MHRADLAVPSPAPAVSVPSRSHAPSRDAAPRPASGQAHTSLPPIATPWRRPAAVDSTVTVDVTHVTDPLCPWAYSFEPVLRALESRYGDQLRFRTVLVGLVETVAESMQRGSTAEGRARSALEFRRFGMPITPFVRTRVLASGPACRLVKAADLQSPDLGESLLRLLRLAWWTTPLLLDEDEALATICERVEGLDVGRALADLRSADVEAAYQADRREARTPHPIAVTLRRTARSDGPERHTAPTLLFTAADGRVSVAPGFQPLEAAEVALLNLEPRLRRLPTPALPDLLSAYPGGLTSQEVARVLADTTATPDRDAAETALVELVASGRARQFALGDDALWTIT